MKRIKFTSNLLAYVEYCDCYGLSDCLLTFQDILKTIK